MIRRLFKARPVRLGEIHDVSALTGSLTSGQRQLAVIRVTSALDALVPEMPLLRRITCLPEPENAADLQFTLRYLRHPERLTHIRAESKIRFFAEHPDLFGQGCDLTEVQLRKHAPRICSMVDNFIMAVAQKAASVPLSGLKALTRPEVTQAQTPLAEVQALS